MQSNIVRRPVLTGIQYSTQRQTLPLRSASRDLQGYIGETGVEYNQTDFSTV